MAANTKKKGAVIRKKKTKKWKDGLWMGRRKRFGFQKRPVNIYEAHASSWKLKEDGQPYTFKELKICVGYKLNGKDVEGFPANLKDLEACEAVYETLPGWETDISGIRKYEDLPENARKYVERIAEVTGVPLGIVSVGPNRNQTIDLVNVF